MEVKTYNSISDIDEQQWNAIVGHNRLICRHEYLRAVESSDINDCRYFYPVVFDGSRILAHTCLYYISTELDAFAQGILKKGIHAIRRVWKRFLILRSIECGTPVALGNTLSFSKDVDQPAALSLLAQEAERIARDNGVKVVLFRDFYEGELPRHTGFLDRGYRMVNNLPSVQLRLHWTDFTDYLSAMRSQYRCKLLAQKKRAENDGVTLDLITDFARLADDLAHLWKLAYDHASEYRRELLQPDFFSNVSTILGNRSAVILARVDDKIVGFLLLLLDDDTMTPIFCGLDYELSRTYGVYFNLFYKAIDIAMTRGFKDVDMGITTVPPKLDLGGILAPLYMYMKHLNPALNRIVPRLFGIMTPQPSVTARHVFKD